jgi:formylglycine-generating enzyme required for sulfatase activity
MGFNPSNFKGSDRPLDSVTWHHVQNFMNTLNKLVGCEGCIRLPTEAEWKHDAEALSMAHRYLKNPNTISSVIGFRVAISRP